jgi:hypothetical protein
MGIVGYHTNAVRATFTSHQLSAISFQPSAFSHQLSAFLLISSADGADFQ